MVDDKNHFHHQPRQQPTTQFFTGQMNFLPRSQQRLSTEGILAFNLI